jgi:hypothetical protein
MLEVWDGCVVMDRKSICMCVCRRGRGRRREEHQQIASPLAINYHLKPNRGGVTCSRPKEGDEGAHIDSNRAQGGSKRALLLIVSV